MDKYGTRPAENSRFYGKGRITEDQKFYNMQTQFFHQMIQAWRFSGDAKFAEILREALRLHLEWEDECFDPDNTGLYASVINTWPTDCVSYGDAGAVEETAYAYAARKAMAELTEGEESRYYAEKAEKIKEAFFRELWIDEKGYPGVYRDRGGRLHEDAWLYSSFLPVECDLLDMFQTAQALYYPLWALERGDDGGFWMSNWTPGIWSVRENAGGENMQQACAFLKGGEAALGLETLSRCARKYLDTMMPGDMVHPTVEVASLYIKTVVEGLFGYRPDYPNEQVLVAPALPFEWKRAEMQTGDVQIEWETNRIRIKLSRPARLTVRMRLYAETLFDVIGAEEWCLEPGIGGMYVVLKAGFCEEAEMILKTGGEKPFCSYEEMHIVPKGDDVFNPQGIDEHSWGEHMAFRKLPEGYYQKILVHLGEDPEKQLRRQKQLAKIPEGALYECISISDIFNEDVTHIFKNEYLSPRPTKGCSAQIGPNGYSLWVFPLWGMWPPEMKLTNKGMIKDPSDIPYMVSDGEKNIVFTSCWDNFPTQTEIPIGKAADQIAILVAGSTNPLQCGIENARITFVYEDGETEDLPLINPQNYISLCAYVPQTVSERDTMRYDVFDPKDISLMRDFTPEIVELGEHVRGLSIRWVLREGKVLKSLLLTACSNDIVCGIMSVTLIRDNIDRGNIPF